MLSALRSTLQRMSALSRSIPASTSSHGTWIRHPNSSSLLPSSTKSLIPIGLDHPFAHLRHGIEQTQKRFGVANYRPKKLRFKKSHKGTFTEHTGGSLRGTTLLHGQVGLAAMFGKRLKDSQLDAIRNSVRRILKPEKGAKLYLRCFPHRPVTKKALNSRMGKGKGAVEFFAVWMDPGKVILEIRANNEELRNKALRTAASMLPVRTFLVKRDSEETLNPPRVLPHFLQKRYNTNKLQEKLHDFSVSRTPVTNKS